MPVERSVAGRLSHDEPHSAIDHGTIRYMPEYPKRFLLKGGEGSKEPKEKAPISELSGKDRDQAAAILVDIVAEEYGLTGAQLQSKTRTTEYVVPRALCAYILRIKLQMSLASIGQVFGGRDHTTIMYNIQQVEAGAFEYTQEVLDIVIQRWERALGRFIDRKATADKENLPEWEPTRAEKIWSIGGCPCVVTHRSRDGRKVRIKFLGGRPSHFPQSADIDHFLVNPAHLDPPPSIHKIQADLDVYLEFWQTAAQTEYVVPLQKKRLSRAKKLQEGLFKKGDLDG